MNLHLPFDEHPETAYQFYDSVKNLVDKAFRLDPPGIDFVNAEDLERLLDKYNPYPPTTPDEDSYDEPEADSPTTPNSLFSGDIDI